MLLTGAGGFVGSHLTAGLVRAGYSVRAVLHYNGRRDRASLVHLPPEIVDQAELVWGDVTDAGQMMQLVAGCDAVLHLAALIGIPYSYAAPSSYMSVNTTGTLNVLEACRSNGVDRLVVTSTSEVYGTAQTELITESHPLVAQSPYAASKIAADKLAEAYCRSFEVPVVTMRPFNAFGPHQSLRAVLPTIITQALAGSETIELGHLWPERDLLFVEDLVRAYLLALETPGIEGETVHVGTGRSVSIGELANLCVERIGSDAAVVSSSGRARPHASEVGRLRCDAAKANRLLGWSPQHTLEQGLDATIDFYRSAIDPSAVGEYVV